jgi:hypothetical protein
MPKLTDYTKIYDPNDMRVKDQNKALIALSDASPAAVLFWQRNRGLSAYTGNPVDGPKALLSVQTIFGRVVPSIASFLGFSATAELGFYKMNTSTKELTLINPDTPWGEDPMGFQAVNVAEYYNGKARTARDDNGNTWQCNITITEAAWRNVESQATAADPASIKGILSSTNVWISPISKKKGDRCIKPEPYGWIFSTNGSVRLIDSSTSVTNARPATLSFTEVRNVK